MKDPVEYLEENFPSLLKLLSMKGILAHAIQAMEFYAQDVKEATEKKLNKKTKNDE